MDTERFRYIARKQYQTREVVVPPRGIIFDRNMNPLVTNIHKVTVSADPFKIKNVDSVASILASVFGKDRNEYIEKLSNKNSPVFYVERKVVLQDLKGLDTLKIEGLNVIKDPSRYYNFGVLASQVIGFTDLDNKGVSGIELAFNRELTGKEGYIIAQRDGKGNKRPDLDFIQKEQVPGNNIILTIDKTIQQIAEEELDNGVKLYGAVKGKAVVIAVKTGEILGMCSYPSFDANNIKTEDTVGMKNSIISDIYEPGSTFKIITAAACLEENLENSGSSIFTENGEYIVYGMKIKDSYPAGNLTFQQVIERSSNIGVAKLSQKLGAERFYKYARDFGFGIYSGVELTGENKGYLKRPIDFTNGSLEFMSIGYQIAINALQLSMAYCSVANGGALMKPILVKRQFGSDGSMNFENQPSIVRQVITKETARKLTELFTGVVDRGTGIEAQINGVKVAGKTGTTQKIIDGVYSSDSHISSFVGYFPAEDPEVLITIILDDPKNGFYGGKVSAPVFQKIAARIISYVGSEKVLPGMINNDFRNPLNIDLQKDLQDKNPPNAITDGKDYMSMPNLVDVKIDDAQEILREKKIKFVVKEDSSVFAKRTFQNSTIKVVRSQNPQPGEKLDETTVVFLSSKMISSEFNTSVIVPDVRYLSLRKSINRLISEGFTIDVNGSGEVIDQYPKPGTRIPSKSKIVLFCKNEI
jgi:cell division protein FtsI/penicillin-binding protein 2